MGSAAATCVRRVADGAERGGRSPGRRGRITRSDDEQFHVRPGAAQPGCIAEGRHVPRWTLDPCIGVTRGLRAARGRDLRNGRAVGNQCAGHGVVTSDRWGGWWREQ